MKINKEIMCEICFILNDLTYKLSSVLNNYKLDPVTEIELEHIKRLAERALSGINKKLEEGIEDEEA